jgi:hypothetical protein
MRWLAGKNFSLAIALIIFFDASVQSQAQTPQILIRAAHCLAVENLLPSSKTKTPSFGYFLDEESYPGEKVLYVVQFAAPARSSGWGFAVWLTERDGHLNFNIQNNASFVLSKVEFIGVSFRDPPLGGTWTQEHLAAAIKRIEKQPRFAIPVKDLFATDPSTYCESYVDHLK